MRSAMRVGTLILLAGLVVLSVGCTKRVPAPSEPERSTVATPSAASSSPSGTAYLAPPTGIAPEAFGSSQDSWHDSLVSVRVAGDALVVRVTRKVTPAEVGSIKRAARGGYHLTFTKLQIVLDDSGTILSSSSVK